MTTERQPTGECPGSSSLAVGGRCRACGQGAVKPNGRLKRHGTCVRDDGVEMLWDYDR